MSPDQVTPRPAAPPTRASWTADWRSTAPSDRSADRTASGVHCAAAVTIGPGQRLARQPVRRSRRNAGARQADFPASTSGRSHAGRRPPAAHRCVPASVVDHIRHAPAHPECGLRLEAEPGRSASAANRSASAGTSRRGPDSVMFRAGVKEGPMKGFVPPPRLSLSSEPLPITRAITISEGISVKDLAEKLGIRAKDLIARLLARGVFATVNQTLDADLATDMARHFGASTDVITFEEQLGAGQRALPTARAKTGGASGVASAGGHHHGSRRSRQDQPARRDPLHQRRRRRSRWNHAAHRRLQGGDHRYQLSGLWPRDRVPRHAGPRSVYPHACPRIEGHRHRGSGGRGRRRRDAADAGGHRPRYCGQGADHRGGQQDRQARCPARPGEEAACRSRA